MAPPIKYGGFGILMKSLKVKVITGVMGLVAGVVTVFTVYHAIRMQDVNTAGIILNSTICTVSLGVAFALSNYLANRLTSPIVVFSKRLKSWSEGDVTSPLDPVEITSAEYGVISDSMSKALMRYAFQTQV